MLKACSKFFGVRVAVLNSSSSGNKSFGGAFFDDEVMGGGDPAEPAAGDCTGDSLVIDLGEGLGEGFRACAGTAFFSGTGSGAGGASFGDGWKYCGGNAGDGEGEGEAAATTVRSGCEDCDAAGFEDGSIGAKNGALGTV